MPELGVQGKLLKVISGKGEMNNHFKLYILITLNIDYQFVYGRSSLSVSLVVLKISK